MKSFVSIIFKGDSMKTVRLIFLVSLLLVAFSRTSLLGDTNNCTAWVSSLYCSYQCDNDGHTFNIDAFASIEDALSHLVGCEEVTLYVKGTNSTTSNSIDGDLHINGGELTISGQNGLTVTGDVYLNGDAELIGGDLIVDGTFVFVNSILTIGDNNLITGGFQNSGPGHYVKTDGEGQVSTSTSTQGTLVPVGNSGDGYTPVVIQPNDGGAVFAVKSEEDPTFRDQDANAVGVGWQVTPPEGFQGQATVSFVYPKSSCPPGFNPATAVVYHYHNGHWIPLPNCTTQEWPENNNYWITTAPNITQFSPFGISSDGVIPVFKFWHFAIAGAILVLIGAAFVYRRFVA